MSVVSDASPLIALNGIGRLEILEQLYATVLIPPAVSREVFERHGRESPSWIETRLLSQDIPASILEERLGKGEAEAISLALEEKATLLLLDDRRARSLARSLGLPIVGVGGVLVAAKKRGLLESVSGPLDHLIQEGFRIAPDLLEELLRLAGEAE